MAVTRIVANLASDRIEAVAAFYETVFGLARVMDHGWIVALAAEGTQAPQLAVAVEGGSGTPVPDLSIEVDDLDAVLARARAAAVAIEYGPADEPWGVRRFYLRDPAGRLVNVLSHDGSVQEAPIDAAPIDAAPIHAARDPGPLGTAGAVRVRRETPADRAGIRTIATAAFPSRAEADLVDRLRADGDLVLSLVAEAPGGLVGHAALSRMRAPFRALGLGPVAVQEGHRRGGVAGRLIEHALALAAEGGWEGVVVLGDPAYYGRFGFAAGLAAGYASPHAGPHLMALALRPEGLPRTGAVEYPPAFAALG